LENNLGISEKTLAEFIIELAKGNKNVKDFRKALDENGAEMPESLVETLWNIIERLQVKYSFFSCLFLLLCVLWTRGQPGKRALSIPERR
jgi:hypothetical protein